MITEVLDRESGAILFKPDQESKILETLQKDMKSLMKKVDRLEKRIKELEENNSK